MSTRPTHRLHRRDFHRALAAAAAAGCLTRTRSARGEPLEHPGQPTQSDPDPIAIIDTHQHLWDLSVQRVPWLNNATDVLRRSYVTSDYLQATEGLNVVKAIYMEVDVAPEDHVAEAELITQLCRSDEHPTVAAVIGGRPNEPTFEPYIREMAKNPYVKGVRQVLHGGTPPGFCLEATFVRSMHLLGELGLSFDLCLRPQELADAVRLVDQCPDTQFVLDHCGNADPNAFLPASRRPTAKPSHDPDAWRRHIAALGERKHVVCKISGIVAQVPQPDWSAEDLAPIVNHCLDAFGPDRVIFGSDWPVCRVGAELADWVRALQAIVHDRPRDQQRKLFHDNAQALFRV
jgi:L-fuconolactonase